jgi:hypothetical protein
VLELHRLLRFASRTDGHWFRHIAFHSKTKSQ